MNDAQKQLEVTNILSDLDAVLREYGKTDKEIQQTIFQLVTKVEMAVVDELIETLPPEKQKQLQAMSEQQTVSEEFLSFFQISPEQIQEIETRKFQEVIGEFLDTLTPQK